MSIQWIASMTISGDLKMASSLWPLATSLIRTHRSVPLVSVLERFDCRYVLPQRVWFLGLFGLNWYTFCPFWSGIGYGFWGNYGSGFCCFISKWILRKKEQYTISKWILRHLSFGVLISVMMTHLLLRDQVWNRYGFQRPGPKTGVENDTFWSEIGSGFGDEPAGGTPPPRIPRSTPRDFFTLSFLLSCAHILKISPFAIKIGPCYTSYQQRAYFFLF